MLSNSPDREITKARKVYFLDNRIAAASADLKKLKFISGNLAIDKGYVIGRHPAKIFDDYIWGGFIQDP